MAAEVLFRFSTLIENFLLRDNPTLTPPSPAQAGEGVFSLSTGMGGRVG